MFILPVAHKFLKLSSISYWNVINMSVFLPLQNNGLRDTLITHSLRVWLMPRFAILFNFIVKIHWKLAVLAFLIRLMKACAFLSNLWNKVLKWLMFNSFNFLFTNRDALNAFSSWRMRASRDYRKLWVRFLFNFFNLLFFFFRPVFSINSFMH